jgi:simple sugar transport system permease protein
MIQRAIRLVAKDRQLLIIVGITVLAFVGLSVLRGETFLTPRNLTSMALQVSDLGVLALAMMIAMVIGGIDLSVTAAANLSAIVAARVVLPLGADGPLALLLIVSVAIAVGLLCGLINGTLIGLAGVPPILATLGTLTLFAGVATVLTNGVSIYGFPKSLTDVGTSSIAFIPVPLILVAVAAVGVWVLLNRTPFGLKM